MFSTDGCMPGPQFDNPVEGCGLCLKLGSLSKAELQAHIFPLSVCLKVLMVDLTSLQPTGELLYEICLFVHLFMFHKSPSSFSKLFFFNTLFQT